MTYLGGHAGPKPANHQPDAPPGEGTGEGVDVEEQVRDELKHPPQYAVILLNDDYTAMDFVVEILKGCFHKTEEEAMQIMLRVHHEGRGIAGIYSFEIAETKVFQVHQLAKGRGYPLHCAVEPVK